MRNQFTVALALAVAAVLMLPFLARSAEPGAGMAMTDAKMTEHCEKMKEHKRKMMEETKTQDAQLKEDLARMNRAPEGQKMELLAAVVTRLVEQRIAMDEHRAKMEDEMMKQMSQRMGKGPMCPMMK
jgi:hypothetical protein